MNTLPRTVLVIDDEEPVREAVEDILALIDVRVLSAVDAFEGIRLFRQSAAQIGLVLLDLHMPKMGGQEVFYQLREIDPDVQIVFSSGYEKSNVAHLLRLDYAEIQSLMFLQKPYSIDSLLDMVQQVLAITSPALE